MVALLDVTNSIMGLLILFSPIFIFLGLRKKKKNKLLLTVGISLLLYSVGYYYFYTVYLPKAHEENRKQE